MDQSQASSGLVELTLDGTGISSKGIIQMIKGSDKLPDLQRLDISRCKMVTGECLSPGVTSKLCVLRATSCPGIRAVNMMLPSSSTLTDINLANSKNLKQANISSQILEELNLSGCQELEQLSLCCQRLRRIKLSGCKRLNFRNSLGDASGVFQCPNLEELNLFGCRSLVDEILGALVGCMPKLRSLDISGCIWITSLNIETEGLTSLQAYGCSNLRTVHISSTQLKELIMTGCQQLHTVVLKSPKPCYYDFTHCPQLSIFKTENQGSITL